MQEHYQAGQTGLFLQVVLAAFITPDFGKWEPTRTDNGTGLGQPNGAITRPWNIAKFSEFYLIAAEAAVKGATGTKSARELVNVLRARAGKWRWKNNGNYLKVEDNSAAMVAATPSVIDIDYILEERSREILVKVIAGMILYVHKNGLKWQHPIPFVEVMQEIIYKLFINEQLNLTIICDLSHKVRLTG